MARISRTVFAFVVVSDTINHLIFRVVIQRASTSFSSDKTALPLTASVTRAGCDPALDKSNEEDEVGRLENTEPRVLEVQRIWERVVGHGQMLVQSPERAEDFFPQIPRSFLL